MSYTDTQAQSPLIINQMPTATYEETTKSSSEVYVVTDPAGKNMNNLTDTGYSVLNNSKALETGAVCSDKKIYNDVYKYAHSSFDISKFTLYGTPTITENGIASGFSSSDGIYVPTLKPGSSAWEVGIEHEVTAEAIADSNASFVLFTDGADQGINIQSRYTNVNYDGFVVVLKFSDDTSTDSSLNCNSGSNGKCVASDKQRFVLGYDGVDTYYFKAFKNGVLYASSNYTTTTSQILKQTANYDTIGFRRGTRGSKNKIDLKTYYVKFDGYPVFLGNKTGIDVIKADNFTRVGSPTITADGMASGFTTSDFIKKENAVTIGADGNFRIDYVWDVTSSSDIQYAFDLYIDTTKELVLRKNSNGGIALLAFSPDPGGGSANILNVVQGGADIKELNVGYIEYKDNKWYWVNNGIASLNGTTHRAMASGTYSLSLGIRNVGNNPTQPSTTGYVSLSDFKVTTKESYQPCLKIPYTQTAEQYGSKIVDAVYRERVTDAYNQGYLNRYYTIDEANKNFTLPQGEVYGLIETTVERNQLVAQSLNVVQNSQKKGLNENIFNSLRDDFHSSFDKSKFKKTGSPLVTDNGIASGFSNDDSFYIDGLASATLTYNSIILGAAFTYNSSATHVALSELRTGDNNNRITLDVNTGSNKFKFSVNASGTAYNLTTSDSTLLLTNNHKYSAWVVVNATNATGYLLDLDTNTLQSQTITTGSLPVIDNRTLYRIGRVYQGNTYSDFLIDLKYVFINLDNILVFSGNKTGIDTIKADDYTVNGSLTISSDGVATGFTGSNYISASPDLSSAWEATFSFKLIELESVNVFPLLFYSGFNRMGVHKDKYTIIFVDENNTTDHHVALFGASTPFKVGVNYLLKVKFDGTSTYSGVLVDLDNNVTYRDSQTLAYKFPSNVTWNFYRAPFTAVDLNLTKVYVNGNLVFQPCLKIPYVSSKDGKKMTYPIYQPRVQNCYEQFGQANYTVIDEENKEYFLPLGSASGFYGKRVLADSYRNGINYWEVYSDGTVEQGGSCTSGTAVNLLKPFADTNYVITVPYSAKTKTSFTPTQTGDWIAKGQGSL